MTPNTLETLAADIAARVPAMAQDCALNNAELIKRLILASEEADRLVTIRESRLITSWWKTPNPST